MALESAWGPLDSAVIVHLANTARIPEADRGLFERNLNRLMCVAWRRGKDWKPPRRPTLKRGRPRRPFESEFERFAGGLLLVVRAAAGDHPSIESAAADA
jgi:hypothetical protein